MAILVREQALDKQAGARSSRVIEVLHKVVGIADLYAWSLAGTQFDEINPRTVKKLVTDDADADKDKVASSLAQFVGEKVTYDCDDESDAVAVGIAWLIQHGKIASPYQKEEQPEPAEKKPRRARKKT